MSSRVGETVLNVLLCSSASSYRDANLHLAGVSLTDRRFNGCQPAAMALTLRGVLPGVAVDADALALPGVDQDLGAAEQTVMRPSGVTISRWAFRWRFCPPFTSALQNCRWGRVSGPAAVIKRGTMCPRLDKDGVAGVY